MKAVEYYLWYCSWLCYKHGFLVKVVLIFDSVDENQKYAGPFKMKATEQYFPVVLFRMLHKVVLTFESVDEILKCKHSD